MLVKNVENQYLVVLERGQKIMSTLTEIAGSENIKGGRISGIGAVTNVELGYFSLEKKGYVRKSFNDREYELINLEGNLSLNENSPFAHVHAALGKTDFSLFGGHLFEAEVAVTAEIYITPFGAMPERELNSEIGLHTIVRCPIV